MYTGEKKRDCDPTCSSNSQDEDPIRLISSTVSYGKLLLDSMKSTYTNPFELQTENVIFGLDKVNPLGEDGTRSPRRLKRRQVIDGVETGETSTKDKIEIPKYDNYMRNTHSWNTIRSINTIPPSSDTR